MRTKRIIRPPTLEETKKKAYRKALIFTRGKRQKAAAVLAVPERTFFRNLKKYDINANDYRVGAVIKEDISHEIKDPITRAMFRACQKCRGTLTDKQAMRLCIDCPNRVEYQGLNVGEK